MSHQQIKDIKLNSNTDNFIPAGRQACIWMEAGLISYRLCDQNLQCDGCALDKAIRRPMDSRSIQGPGTAFTQAGKIDLLHSLRQLAFNPEAYYGHSFWYLETGLNAAIKLGLNETAVKLLPDVLEMMIPCRDSRLQEHQPAFCFKTQHGMLTLKSPIAGLVTKVNNRLMDDLKQHKKGISGPVRLLSLQAGKKEALEKKWLSAKPAMDFLKNQQEAVLDRFSHELFSPSATLGPTSNDGGNPIENLEMAIGPARYLQIIQDLFED